MHGRSADSIAYRDQQSYLVNSSTNEIVYTPPAPHKVPALMHQMALWLNRPGDIHPVLISGIAQFQFMHIHPFMEGNGRTSRLLSIFCSYRTGYDFKRLFTISEFYDHNPAAFHRALQGVRLLKIDLTNWLEFFTNGLAKQLEKIKGSCEALLNSNWNNDDAITFTLKPLNLGFQ